MISAKTYLSLADKTRYETRTTGETELGRESDRRWLNSCVGVRQEHRPICRHRRHAEAAHILLAMAHEADRLATTPAQITRRRITGLKGVRAGRKFKKPRKCIMAGAKISSHGCYNVFCCIGLNRGATSITAEQQVINDLSSSVEDKSKVED